MGVFDEYIKGGNPSQKEKSYAWKTAVGLQDVDGLKPSEYLLETARQNIEGDITIEEVKELLDTYYRSKSGRQAVEERTEEADKVSARIAELLTEPTFNFTPDYLIQIHRRLFTGIYKEAGAIRTYNITKKEWVLDSDTVLYSSHDMITQTLEYDFREEKNTDYSSLNALQAVRHICRFISGIWQIHPFCEGNTRTTAVFAIKYLRNFGFEVENEAFADNSWYFRNALVRANYVNYSKNVAANPVFLEHFFENLLLNAKYELRNREMHVSYSKTGNEIQANGPSGTLDVTLDERVLLNTIKLDPRMTQEALASHIGKSVRTVKRLTASLSEKGIIKRESGKRNGFWKIIE
ncbi:MAG: Fic family protein [Bacteroidales bacterium]|nr:Fic family protein [Bacteroidales bacterium]